MCDVRMYVCMHARTQCVYMCTDMYVCMYICMEVYVCVVCVPVCHWGVEGRGVCDRTHICERGEIEAKDTVREVEERDREAEREEK